MDDTWICWAKEEKTKILFQFIWPGIVVCSVTKSCLTICYSMHCSTPGIPVFQYLPEFAQTHVHWVSDTIQPSHPLLPPSLPALNLSLPQSFPLSWLFNSGGQSIGTSATASIIPMNTHGWFSLQLTGLISLLSKRFSRVFFSTTIQKHQFSGIQFSLWSNSHILTWLLEKT